MMISRSQFHLIFKVVFFIAIQTLAVNLHGILLAKAPALLILTVSSILTLSMYKTGKTLGGFSLCSFFLLLIVLNYFQANGNFSSLLPLTHLTVIGSLHLPLRIYAFMLLWVFCLYSCGSVLGETVFRHPKYRMLGIICTSATLIFIIIYAHNYLGLKFK